MRVIIAGSRTAKLESVLKAMSKCPWPVSEVVCGGAKGADSHGEYWASMQEPPAPVKYFHADWATHGKAAGPLRNRDMALYADALVLVWDGKSKGSLNMLELALSYGLKLYVLTYPETLITAE